MQSLRVFLNERLSLVAEEIFEAVEKTIAGYTEEILRSKDLEISRLRMQLKLLKSKSVSNKCLESQQQHSDHRHYSPPLAPLPPEQLHHQSFPAVATPEPHHCGEEGDSSLDQELPEISLVKNEEEEQEESAHSHYWINHAEGEEEHVEDSDMRSSPTDLKANLPEQSLHFQHFLNNSSGEENRDKPYICSVCEKRFSNCSHLAAHIRTHTGERPYMCDTCKKTFITTSALNRHKTIHTEGKRFICNCCGKSFKWMESLGRHMRSVHKDGMPE
ncbi:adult enhancer factor 1 [Nematolebias whitei]|uniref:adult enhancer factor 1 n=1 Tax=Nematolebias whitei TaxID=451745 RepID=UPI00189BC3DE|nr:adult enhancer factor 1 [Nematolebias whitei]